MTFLELSFHHFLGLYSSVRRMDPQLCLGGQILVPLCSRSNFPKDSGTCKPAHASAIPHVVHPPRDWALLSALPPMGSYAESAAVSGEDSAILYDWKFLHGPSGCESGCGLIIEDSNEATAVVRYVKFSYLFVPSFLSVFL